MIYFAPFSPRAEEAINAVGSPVSQPSIPIKIINTQISAYPSRMARTRFPRERPLPNMPPIIRAGTQITEPIQTIAMEPQRCRSSVLISKPVIFFMMNLPFLFIIGLPETNPVLYYKRRMRGIHYGGG